MLDKVKIRQARPGDTGFICNSWLKSYSHSKWATAIPTEIYYKEHNAQILKAIKSNMVYLAVNPEDEDQIFGWACFTLGFAVPVIHYVYVKQSYRRFGIFKKLMSDMLEEAFIYTHEPTINKLTKNGVYSPYHFFNIKGEL